MTSLTRVLLRGGLAAVAAGGALVGAVPAQAAAPLHVDVICESLGHYHLFCERDVTGGTAPFTTKWFFNGTYFAAYDGRQFVSWGCYPNSASTSKAVVTDATGATVEGSAGGRCLAGAP